MGTGACGIDCTVCRLHVQGLCSTCGSGLSEQGKAKLEAQKKLFGRGCPILECAYDRKLGFCLRDCDEFPCEHFSSGPYPYGEGFLEMQKRRREQLTPDKAAAWPEQSATFWERLGKMDAAKVCANSGAAPAEGGCFDIQCLNESWHVDPTAKTIIKTQGVFGGEWDRQAPFLILIYLTTASEEALSGSMVAPRELTAGKDFIQGRYELLPGELEDRFGKEPEYFDRVCKTMGAEKIEGADIAFRFYALPKIPVDFLLWQADAEFPAKVTILLDQGTLDHFYPDATSVLVNLLISRLLMAAKG